MLSGIETLKASGSEHRAVEHWSGLFVEVLNATLARGRLNALVQSLIGSLGFASPLVILAVGAVLVLDGSLSLGTMLALNALAAGFLVPFSSLIQTAVQFRELGSYLDRIADVLETAPEQCEDRVRPAPPLRGRVTLEEVTFRYARDARPAVRDVSLDILPGQLVAVVGRSAAGKSTLANLLMALYRPQEGVVRYDGLDLADLDVRTVRRQLGVVMQHQHLFGLSIRRNIALSDPDASLEAVRKAARLACIDEDIVAMPLAYDTVLVDGGLSLSGGQRQRLALARALLGDPAILVLDEATSALDADTERRVQASLAELACTRIVIAHRLSTVHDADVIFVLDDGALVAQGTHEELLAGGGVYHDLVAGQVLESS
jgi:ABC-type bacteriocin/lantibiotic exporter with double-glycine peptidase domain